MKQVLVIILLSFFQNINAEEVLNFTTKDGVDYKNSRIRGHSIDGLRITHSAGAATIPYEMLPEEIQEKIGYDEEFKAKLAEARKRNTQDQQVETERREQIAKVQRLKTSAEKHRIEVVQVLENGVLADKLREHFVVSRMQSIGAGGRPASAGFRRSGNVFFYQNVKGVADGDRLSVSAARDGVFSYDDVLGARRTVQNWIVLDRL